MYCQPWHTDQRGRRALLDVIKPHSQNLEQGERKIFLLTGDLQVDGWAAPDTPAREIQDREKQFSLKRKQRDSH